MPNILLIHGINLNILGKRNVEHYGTLTLQHIEDITRKEAKKYGYQVISYQSNHEGHIVDQLQLQSPHCEGIIINAGALTHYSYGLHDALLDTNLPAIEIHLSDVSQREIWRRQSVIEPACIGVVMGKKEQGYLEAVQRLVEHLQLCK
jgi:3-dehydroquinate dehydratase-2